jgi:hypothetical protein
MKVRSQNHSQVPSNAPRPETWEYLTVTGEAESPALLAEHGAQGWELVSVVREFGTRATFYFKRRCA